MSHEVWEHEGADATLLRKRLQEERQIVADAQRDARDSWERLAAMADARDTVTSLLQVLKQHQGAVVQLLQVSIALDRAGRDYVQAKLQADKARETGEDEVYFGYDALAEHFLSEHDKLRDPYREALTTFERSLRQVESVQGELEEAVGEMGALALEEALSTEQWAAQAQATLRETTMELRRALDELRTTRDGELEAIREHTADAVSLRHRSITLGLQEALDALDSLDGTPQERAAADTLLAAESTRRELERELQQRTVVAARMQPHGAPQPQEMTQAYLRVSRGVQRLRENLLLAERSRESAFKSFVAAAKGRPVLLQRLEELQDLAQAAPEDMKPLLLQEREELKHLLRDQ